MSKKRKKKSCLRNIVKPHVDSAPSCHNGTCGISSKLSSTHAIYTKFSAHPVTPHDNSTFCFAHKEDESFLAYFFPADIYATLVAAAKKSMLLAFLCTLTEDVLTDLMKPHGYSKKQIYVTNQVIKALILLWGGLSLGKTVAGPLVNFLLVNGFQLDKDAANHYTLASIMAFDVLTNPLTLPKIMTVSTMIGTGLLVSKASQYCYRRIKTCLFSSQASPMTEPGEKTTSQPTHSL